MRFAITAILFVVAVFGFFVGYAVSSYLLSSVSTALEPLTDSLSTTNARDDITLLCSGFGIICALALVIIIAIFILDSLSDEPESYWRE